MRTIAVVDVLLFHLGVPFASGGYVGVDVFFVISGFLITGKILKQIDEGRFTFSDFYLDRARRLLPALIFTLGATMIAAAALFSPSHFEAFARSLGSSTVALSNFHFWRQSGYFDIASLNKPLLHTWSLGVEEQFYLAWPVLLLALASIRHRMMIPMAVTALASVLLVAAEYWARIDHAAAYYLPWFRVPELALGGLVYCLRDWTGWRRINPTAATLAGLALIITPVGVYSSQTIFPGLNAMVPCFGAAILIGIRPQCMIARLYDNSAFAKIGVASYSLYLIHWPLIVFYRYYTGQSLSVVETLILAGLSVSAGLLMRRYVEQPFLRQTGRVRTKSFIASAAAASVVMLVLAYSAIASAGWPWRIPAKRIMSTPAQYLAEETRLCGEAESSKGLVTCQVERNSEQSIYVFGDSHARHLIAGLESSYPDHNIRIMYFTGCLPNYGTLGYTYSLGTQALNDACGKRNSEALKFFASIPPTTIILSFWMIDADLTEVFKRSISSVVHQLISDGHRVRVLSDVIRPGISLSDCYAVPRTISDKHQEKRCRGNAKLDRKLVSQNEKLAQILGAPPYVDMSRFFCPSDYCRASIDGKLLFRDSNHLTIDGSRLYIATAKPFLAIDEED